MLEDLAPVEASTNGENPSAMIIRSVTREHSRSTNHNPCGEPDRDTLFVHFPEHAPKSRPETVGSPKSMNCPIQAYMKALDSGSSSPKVEATQRQR